MIIMRLLDFYPDIAQMIIVFYFAISVTRLNTLSFLFG